MDAMQQVLVFASAISAIVIALVQLVKNTISIPKNYVPLVGLVIGLLVGFAGQPFTDLDLVLRLWAGGFAGLAATGAYEIINNRQGMTK